MHPQNPLPPTEKYKKKENGGRIPRYNLAPEPMLMAPFETYTLRRYVAARSTPRRSSMRTRPLVQTGLLPEPSSAVHRSSHLAQCGLSIQQPWSG